MLKTKQFDSNNYNNQCTLYSVCDDVICVYDVLQVNHVTLTWWTEFQTQDNNIIFVYPACEKLLNNINVGLGGLIIM